MHTPSLTTYIRRRPYVKLVFLRNDQALCNGVVHLRTTYYFSKQPDVFQLHYIQTYKLTTVSPFKNNNNFMVITILIILF